MEITDYNGEGSWSRTAILERYARYAAEMGIVARDLTPLAHVETGRKWVYPVMDKVIDGIKANDPACIRIGIEFIEEDVKFPFGKTLKSNAARALRRATLSDEQKLRIRKRVFGLLQAGHIPHEYREYAKLARKIGFEVSEIPKIETSNPFAIRFLSYFEAVARSGN